MQQRHQKYSSNALEAAADGGLKWLCLSPNSIDLNFYRSILHTPTTEVIHGPCFPSQPAAGRATPGKPAPLAQPASSAVALVAADHPVHPLVVRQPQSLDERADPAGAIPGLEQRR
ncbi:hypothetical protein D3C71_1797960 [compost metagenome]